MRLLVYSSKHLVYKQYLNKKYQVSPLIYLILHIDLVQFQLNDPEPLLYHNEPIFREGEIVGYMTSGMYGHHLGGAIGLGYVHDVGGVDTAYVNEGTFEVLVAGEMVAASASLRPLYDPKSERIKA